ncbi:MAG: nickel pincer cofactor biosynthesis protein LarB [Deltaproteobacteria bacterium]|nr:nickel pincer cofactor biosynthesis protein LarB [Deltaproteobacteria bacterium]
MTREQFIRLLTSLHTGEMTLDQALAQADRHTFEPLEFARLDHQRAERLGFPEVVFAQGKTPDQLAAICQTHLKAHPQLLVTRADATQAAAALTAAPGGEHHTLAKTLTWGLPPQNTGCGLVAVAAAGTADLPVALEAALTARMLGAKVELTADVGVAGLHRLADALPSLRQARAVVAVAGMEGALPSVIGGLLAAPVIACPTSVGYGASMGGLAALLAMLNSCAPGVVVVNIDNGFGAGYAAALINRQGE